MKIKCLYRKNLKLSDQKLAAQTGHVVGNIIQRAIRRLQMINKDTTIIVLKASDKKFEAKHQELKDLKGRDMLIYYLQVDRGLSEIPEGTETVIGWIENE